MPRFSLKVAPGVRAYGGGGGSGAIAVIIVFLIAIAIVFIPVWLVLSLVGHVIGITPTPDQSELGARWLHVHYPDVGFRYVLTADLLIGVVFLFAGVFASGKPVMADAPAPDPPLAVPEERRWVAVIRSTCPACGNADERPGGVFLCPVCGAQIPDEAHAPTGRSVLER
jgi:hypothetical protein